MDPQTLVKSFRSERADRDPQARAQGVGRAWAKIEAATDTDSPPTTHTRREVPRWHWPVSQFSSRSWLPSWC